MQSETGDQEGTLQREGNGSIRTRYVAGRQPRGALFLGALFWNKKSRRTRSPPSPARTKHLLVPGGRVLNPQSYHSAFRISSTRHEEALAGREHPSCALPWQPKNNRDLGDEGIARSRGWKRKAIVFCCPESGCSFVLLVNEKNNLWMFLLIPVSGSLRIQSQKQKRPNGCSIDNHSSRHGPQ
jgi:hypothetical protein